MAKRMRLTKRKLPSETNRLANPNVEFSGKTFERIVGEMKSGALPLDRIVLTDPHTSGLRVFIYKSGAISFHAHYQMRDTSERSMLVIGHYPEMTVADARKITETIHALSDAGVNPMDGLHKRLMRELLEKGAKWRP